MGSSGLSTIQEELTQLDNERMMCWNEQMGNLLDNQRQLASSVKVKHGSLDELIELRTKKKKERVMRVLNVKMMLY